MRGAKKQHAVRLREQLNRLRAFGQRRVGDSGLDPVHRFLSEWQSARLQRTHADLMDIARYQPALRFFLDELYGPKDFSQRDSDIDRIYPMMVRVFSARVIDTVADAVELNVLSYELDHELILALGDYWCADDGLDEQAYAAAYRRCDNRERRARQIDLLRLIGEDLDHIVTNPLVHMTLRLFRKPAHLAGFGELQDFLEQGVEAFRKMGGAQEFLTTIIGREQNIMQRILAGHPRPFALETQT